MESSQKEPLLYSMRTLVGPLRVFTDRASMYWGWLLSRIRNVPSDFFSRASLASLAEMDPQYQPATRPDGLDISFFFHITPNLSCSATSALSKCLPYEINDSYIRWSQHRQSDFVFTVKISESCWCTWGLEILEGGGDAAEVLCWVPGWRRGMWTARTSFMMENGYCSGNHVWPTAALLT